MSTRRAVLFVLCTLPWMGARALAAQAKVLGVLDPFPGDDSKEAGLRGYLREFGYPYAETQQIVVRASHGRDELLPTLAANLVALRPDVILTWGDAAARAAQLATTTIPIVVMTDNLVGSGLVASLHKPGGNMTGVSVMATELDAKRLELLALILPPASRVMLLADSATPPLSRPDLRRTARVLGLQLTEAIVRTPEETQLAIQQARRNGVAGVNVLASPVLFGQMRSIIDSMNAARLPAIFEWGFLADDGALIAYGPQLTPLIGRLLNQVNGVIRGDLVANLPVEQPVDFELVINLKIAKAMSVDIPRALLLRADRVIR